MSIVKTVQCPVINDVALVTHEAPCAGFRADYNIDIAGVFQKCAFIMLDSLLISALCKKWGGLQKTLN